MGKGLYTASDRAELWRQWKAGYSTRHIARALGRQVGSIYQILAPYGGIKPAERTRGPRTLKLSEREDISRGLATGSSIRQIAERLGRAPSTVSREVKRHGGRTGYTWTGRPSRFPGGSKSAIPTMRACTCRMRRFTGHCSFRRVGP